MNIAVLGLGYVGCVSAACLAQQGHRITGVDVNPVKVDLINEGQSPIIEKQLDTLIDAMVARGRLRATTDVASAIADADVSLICVGTPSRMNGSLDLRYVRGVAKDIGHALRDCEEYHVVAVRSTVLPGSIEEEVVPILEAASGKKAGRDFGVCMNPEFLREGTAVDDYYNPSFTLIGALDQRSGAMMEAVYQDIDAPIICTEIRVAEMVKYTSNTYHALKVGFANEIGVLCKNMDIDSHTVMDIFAQDTRLNISAKYLRPGFAFGGSCLPKDVRAITHRARYLDLDLPILQSILPSNEHQIERAFQMVQRSGRRKVGILGLSFKAGTDDLRESPIVYLCERLLGKGYDVRIYDRNVSMAAIMGGNKQYIETVIPHISTLLDTDLDAVVNYADIVIIGNSTPEFNTVLDGLSEDKHVIDLVRLPQKVTHLNGAYQGICW